MSMPIKACGQAEFYRGACRDRYLSRRDCADCEPLKAAAVESIEGDPASAELAASETVDPNAELAAGETVEVPGADDAPAASDERPAQPRPVRGARKRP
jgi:hypothetical protein